MFLSHNPVEEEHDEPEVGMDVDMDLDVVLVNLMSVMSDISVPSGLTLVILLDIVDVTILVMIKNKTIAFLSPRFKCHLEPHYFSNLIVSYLIEFSYWSFLWF